LRSCSAGTPKEIVTRLNNEINKVLVNPAVRKRFAELGLSIEGGNPERASAHIRSEFEKWRQVVRDAGIKPED
jgi:tripartite-type tricarboxylate transporter receptor subunit TctC